MYLDKARSLTKGLRKHLVTVKNYGVSASDLSKLEAAILEGEKLNAEVDRRRAELTSQLQGFIILWEEYDKSCKSVSSEQTAWYTIEGIDMTNATDINRIEARGPTSTRGRHGSRPASHPVAAQAA